MCFYSSSLQVVFKKDVADVVPDGFEDNVFVRDTNNKGIRLASVRRDNPMYGKVPAPGTSGAHSRAMLSVEGEEGGGVAAVAGWLKRMGAITFCRDAVQ